MSQRWVLTALGKDRPGIVAGVTRILYSLGCNLEDSAMSRLAGEFAMMLIFAAPVRLTRAKLDRSFNALSGRGHLVIHLKALTKSELRSVRPSRPHLISVYGGDRPGIVYRVSELLSKLRVNITDVSTQRASRAGGPRRAPLYLMLLEVQLPARLKTARLDQGLRSLAKRLGVQVSLRPADADVL